MDKLSKHQQNQIKELKTFCAQQSVTAENRGIEEMSELVVTKLESIGAKVNVVTVDNSKPFVLAELKAKTGSENKKTVLIYNHYDVQPEVPLDKWDSPPFEPTIRDNKIYARGVADNKANLLYRMQAIEDMLKETNDIPVNIKWLIEGEEEIGSPNITALQQKHGEFWKDCDVCIWESGGVNESNMPELALGLKGALYVELTCEFNKTDMHSSLAAVVDSPVWRLVSALSTIRDENGVVTLDGFNDGILSPTQTELDLMKEMEFDPKRYLVEYGGEKSVADINDKVEFLKHLYFNGTANICGVEAGYNVSKGVKTVLPNKASARLDFRLVPNQGSTDIAKKLRKHLDKRGFNDISIDVLVTFEPGRTHIENEYIQKIISVLRTEYDSEPIVSIIAPASGPIYGIASIYNIPVVRMGTAYANCCMHAPNENIRLPDYFKAQEVFKAFLYKC